MFRAEDPSRIITICPARSFSHASTSVVDS